MKRGENRYMIDLHTHILPGVDDGSPSIDESLVMADMAVNSGVDTIVATSHGCSNNINIQRYWNAYQQLKDALEKRHIPLKLIAGMEIFLTEDVLEAIKSKSLLSINNTKIPSSRI